MANNLETVSSSSVASKSAEGEVPAQNELQATIERAKVEDPLVRFFATNWRVLMVLAVAAALAGLGVKLVGDMKRERQAEGAAAYTATFESMEDVVAARNGLAKASDDESRKKAEAELESALSRARSDLAALFSMNSPYSEIAALYQKILGFYTADQSLVNASAAADWHQLKSGSSERFFAELGAFIEAKALLDDAQRRAEGLAKLKDLALTGEVAQVASAVVMARVATGAEERNAAKEVLAYLEGNQPEQRELLKDSLAALH